MTNDKRSHPEILSPCGSPESLIAAIRCGADAVYIGGKRFSARHNAKNFTVDELKEAVRLCHRSGVLIYQAINTCVFDSELNDLADEIEAACEAGIDGIIIQDPACEYIVRTACPDMPLHASTQMTIHSENGVLRAKERGFERVVLARELDEKTITELSHLGIEIEIFVHGALCMSVSGQCYLSAVIGSRSANRGLCAGACRLPFSASRKPKDRYALSLKDCSLYSEAERLAETGVSSLKIEGRMKRPEYVAAATDSCFKALSGEEHDSETLRAVFSRSGFTSGYFDSRLGKDMFGARSKEDVVSAGDVLPSLKKLYSKEKARLPISFELSVKEGVPAELKASDGEISVSVYGDIPETALNLPLSEGSATTQLSKLGGTVYYLSDIKCDIDPGLMLPLSVINSLRREAIEALDQRRIDTFGTKKPFDREKLILARPKTLMLKKPELWISVERISQLSRTDISGIEQVIIPLSGYREYKKAGLATEKAVLSLPRFTFDEKKLITTLEAAAAEGFTKVLCTNSAHIRIAKNLRLSAFGGWGLNITNSVAAFEYAEEGLECETLSFELKAYQAGAIASPVPTGAIIYGRLPIMLTVNCPINAEVGCKNCTRSLTDRTGAKFPLLCKKDLGYFELLNSKPLIMSDKLTDLNLDFGILMFTTEPAEEVAKTIENYRLEKTPEGDLTRGLYYRGVN